MANAKKLPSGNWRVQVYLGVGDDGKKHKKSITAPTKWECEKLADEYLQGRRECELTVGECMDKYIEVKRNVLSPSTVRNYKAIRQSRLQLLMDKKVTELNSRLVQRAISEDALRATRTTIITSYRTIEAAMRMQGVETNFKVTFPAEKSKIVVLPNPQKVVNAFMGTDIELPCLLAVWGCMRYSEVGGLMRDDLQDGMLYIHRRKIRSEHGYIVQEVNKNKSSCRSLKCPQFIVDRIKAVETEFIVPMNYKTLRCHFSTLMKANGIDNFTFHGLRHMSASIMHVLGVPNKYAMERGGWSSSKVMEGTYQNVFDDERQKVDKTIDNYFESLISGENSHESSHE